MRSLFAFLAALPACSSIQDEIGNRAAFEMQCQADRLSYAELADNVWGVSGCGKRATYQRICGQIGYSPNGYGGGTPILKCQWVKAN